MGLTEQNKIHRKVTGNHSVFVLFLVIIVILTLNILSPGHADTTDTDGETPISTKINVSDHPKPIVSVTKPRVVFVNEPTEFTVNLYSRTGITTRLFGRWVLPDDSYSSGNTLTHTFTEPMVITEIRYEAWYQGYEEDMVVKTVNVYPLEYVFPDFTVISYAGMEGVVPFFTVFRASADTKKPRGREITFDWDFGDSTTFTSTTSSFATKEYTEPGTYTVTLHVVDEQGNVDDETLQIVLREPDPIELSIIKSYSNKYMRDPLVVYAKPQISGGHPRERTIAYQWSVDGVEETTKSRLYYKMPDTGDYDLGIEIQTTFGNTSSTVDTITVVPNTPPTCDFTYEDKPKMPLTYLRGNCVDDDGKVVRYHWDYGDGNEQTSHMGYGYYTKSGTYSVTLTATDDAGAEGSITKPVTVFRE